MFLQAMRLRTASGLYHFCKAHLAENLALLCARLKAGCWGKVWHKSLLLCVFVAFALKNEPKNEPHTPLTTCYPASFPAFEMRVKMRGSAQKASKNA
jgi:hypothetical protein